MKKETVKIIKRQARKTLIKPGKVHADKETYTRKVKHKKPPATE